jgi:predicted restriction endonuclease
MGTSRGKKRIYSWCKICFSKKSRQYQTKNKEQRNTRQRERYWKDPEKAREKARQHAANYRKNHPTEYYIRQKKWREDNRDRFNELQSNSYYRNHEKNKNKHRRWMKSNPSKNLEYKANRRARKLKAGGKFTAKEWRDLLEKYNHRCLCCGSTEKIVADHVLPLSQGGTNDIGNIQPLCFSCNSKKYTKHIDYR